MVIGFPLRKWHRQLLYHRIRQLRKERQKIRGETRAVQVRLRRAMLALIGALVVTWAKIDNGIDLWISVIHTAWGEDNIQADLPRMLDNELKYLRKAANEWKNPAVDSVAWLAIIDKIHQKKEFRHQMVHGDYDIVTLGTIGFSIVLNKTTGNTRREHTQTFTHEEITSKIVEAGLLMTELSAVIAPFVAAFTDVEERDS